MKRRLYACISVLLTLLTCVVPTAFAQRWTVSESAQKSIDEAFGFIERDEAGCALGVVQNGKLAYGRGYGLANMDWRIPITTSTVFDIGSVSKQFTAAALALLELDGVLSLEDDIRKWVPEMPDYGSTITIRHLLNHTSGIRDYLVLEELSGMDFDNVYDEFDGVAVIVRQQGLNFEPGSEYLYSNSGYLLLAHIVRKATGKSLRAFLEERVFDPLGMSATSIWDNNREILAERATGYAKGESGWMIEHAWNFQMGGDGQVITSVNDLISWDANFYDPEVGGEALLTSLHTQGTLNSGETIEYALGLSVDEYRGVKRVQHGGAWAGFRAMMSRFPKLGTSIIVLCNRGDASPGRAADQVADVLLAEHLSPKEGDAGVKEGQHAVEVSTSHLRQWAGLYRSLKRPSYLLVSLVDDQLHLTVGAQLLPLTANSDTEFVLQAFGIDVAFSESEGQKRMQAMGRDYRAVQPETELLPTGVSGDYYSPELDVTWSIKFEGNTGHLHRPGQDPISLEPGILSEYRAGNIALTLTFDEQEQVAGFNVFAGRVTDIGFQRQ